MKYFWWRLIDYSVGVFLGGIIIFLTSKFLCNKCVGEYTSLLFLVIWIAIILAINFVFQLVKPNVKNS